MVGNIAARLSGRVFVSSAHHVCVVDDDQSVRLALASLLRSLGYEVATFESAHALLAWIGANRAACVISDLQMPGMSGMQLFARLREMGVPAPLLLITAYPTAELAERAQAIGVRAFLTKPVNANDLAAHVEAALLGAR